MLVFMLLFLWSYSYRQGHAYMHTEDVPAAGNRLSHNGSPGHYHKEIHSYTNLSQLGRLYSSVKIADCSWHTR